MTDTRYFEAYRILTREWTNMHHTERTALDSSGQLYIDVMELTLRGEREAATDLVIPLITDEGQAWRVKRDVRFIIAHPIKKLAPHGGCWSNSCVECNPY